MSESVIFPSGWVLFGYGISDGSVVILASKEMSEAELRVLEPPAVGPWSLISRLSMDLRRYVLTHAPTYGEALRRLFDFWDPDVPADAEPALPAAVPALSSAFQETQ